MFVVDQQNENLGNYSTALTKSKGLHNIITIKYINSAKLRENMEFSYKYSIVDKSDIAVIFIFHFFTFNCVLRINNN